MSETIGFEDVLLATKRAMAEKGADFIYKLAEREQRMAEGYSSQDVECLYFETVAENTKPSCIVGHVIADLDLPHPSEGIGVDSYFGDLRQRGINLDDRAENFLSYAQAAQDKGLPWGEAYDAGMTAAGG